MANSTAAEPRRLRRNRRKAFAKVKGCGIEETSGRESNCRKSYLKQIVEVFRAIGTERPAPLGEC
jgi:hypothetical protein